ncbi:MAG: HAMP domain-containing sensor histidine kinase [Candidatus Latescibacterota bacterium]
MTVWLTSSLLDITVHPFPLYVVAGFLALCNVLFLLYGRSIGRSRERLDWARVGNRFANLQISVDLVALALLIHFSGGAENPFIFYFIFHMIIASILLSVKATYLQATLAVSLFGAIVGLEYAQVLSHVHLRHFLPEDIYRQPSYVLGVLFVFTTTLYISVSMAISITGRLRKRENQLVVLEESLERANEELRELDRLKSEYVLKVTHELRSPLATIESCLEVATGGSVPEASEKQREMLGRASRRTGALIALINDLLDLSRMKASRTPMPMEPLNLCVIVQQTVDLMHPLDEGKGLLLEMVLPCGLIRTKESCQMEGPKSEEADFPCRLGGIKANKGCMERLLTNLVSNAIRYTGVGGKISIEAHAENGALKIVVSDTGIGIREEDLPMVFDEFYRSERAKVHDRTGTGLGLSLAKQIVESHGGRIWVESEVGKGSKFILLLPKG